MRLSILLEAPNLDTANLQKYTAEIEKIREILRDADEDFLLMPVFEGPRIDYELNFDIESESACQGRDDSELLDNGITLDTFYDQQLKVLPLKRVLIQYRSKSAKTKVDTYG